MKKILPLLFFVTTFGSGLHCQTFEIGQKAPNIIQNSVNGEMLSLDSLKGKMVLIDFWASWCAPCRKETPFLIDAYKKYKDTEFKNGKGFTIYSVSLDMKRTAWVDAISADKMEWPYHVSDLKGWRNEAALQYQIKSVPANFLIDGNGIIIATNLRGEELGKQLKKNKKSIF